MTSSAHPVRDAGSAAVRALADQAACARVARTHARTFALASRFLPDDKRRAAFALYAFCRAADDLVDERPSLGPGEARVRLDALAAGLARALAGAPDGALFRELCWAVVRYAIPPALLHELLDGVARDLEPVGYASWPALEGYCQGVASSVGEMCARVFGVAGGQDVAVRAIGHARTLGVAMQLTNILRDMGEDARRGRCYLPADELAAHGLTPGDVLAGPAVVGHPGWKPLLRFQIARARALYDGAAPGIALLAPDARRCAAACADGYAAILTAIERLDYDTMSTRARVDGLGRLAILWRAWRTPRGDSPNTPPHQADDAIEWA